MWLSGVLPNKLNYSINMNRFPVRNKKWSAFVRMKQQLHIFGFAQHDRSNLVYCGCNVFVCSATLFRAQKLIGMHSRRSVNLIKCFDTIMNFTNNVMSLDYSLTFWHSGSWFGIMFMFMLMYILHLRYVVSFVSFVLLSPPITLLANVNGYSFGCCVYPFWNTHLLHTYHHHAMAAFNNKNNNNVFITRNHM